MEIKKSNIPNNTITRKLTDLDAPTGNIYESVVVISKRANQISSEIKQELNRKLADFSSVNDSLEETFENREQIEISKYYEKLPKPAIIATEEFLEGKVYFRENNEAEAQPQEAFSTVVDGVAVDYQYRAEGNWYRLMMTKTGVDK